MDIFASSFSGHNANITRSTIRCVRYKAYENLLIYRILVLFFEVISYVALNKMTAGLLSLPLWLTWFPTGILI